jgi:hypothetical protein
VHEFQFKTPIEWDVIEEQLLARGFSVLEGLCSSLECDELIACYNHEETFRKTVVMARHNFGSGEYKYFASPLPSVVQNLRLGLYSPLAKIANDWAQKLAKAERWPASYSKFSERCKAAGQVKPTPLMLRYGPGDYNRLHQDIYGEVYFPFQVIVLLSEPQQDFVGGDLVLVENCPRQQSRPHVPTLRKGAAVIIPTRERPIPGARGWRQAQIRHGVSEIVSGQRITLGIIFHDGG